MKKIPLTQGKYAIVDDEDYEHLMQWNWQYGYNKKDKSGQAQRFTRVPKPHIVTMHREVAGHPAEMHVDHKNHDRLDNRRVNLRVCSPAENMRNRRHPNKSGYKGVYFYPKINKWKASIMLNGKSIYLGYFNDPVTAARTYNRAATKYHGEYALLNEVGSV